MQLYIDNWSATLLAPATASAVSLSVEPAKAALLTGLGSGNFYRLTLVEVDASGVEIDWDVVQVTAVAGGVLTVARTGTARSWVAGTLIEARLTATGMEELRDAAGGASVGSALPLSLGAAAPGTSPQASRQDHVHPVPTPGDLGAATAAQGAKADTAVQPAALTAALADKVDKVAGKGLSSNDYTTAEKNKLAALEGSHFKGLHGSLAALQAAHPSAVAGDYADVDAGAGVDVVRYLWDVTDGQWVAQAAAGGSMTAAQVKTAYESNPDTNAFTDAEQAKLGGIAPGATANADTDSLAEGATNKYFTEGRVRGTVLTGLSLLTGGVITAADSVLSSLGKLQKQISDAVTAISGKQDTLVSGTNIKTVNGSSLLGAGDLAISGSGMANPMTTAGDIIVGTSGGTPSRLGMGASLQVLRVNSAGTALEYATPAAGGLTNLSESKNTASPNVSVPAVVLKVSITEANGDVVLEAKGTGAMLAQMPDSAIAGGNKRGEYATDWQKKRTAASQVASGQYACILGGQANTALGQYSIAFGNGSTANGKHALAFGENSSAAGQDAYAIGYACSASGDHGWATGYRATDRGVAGMQARACGGFYASGAGAAQSGWYPLTYQTTDATASVATTNQYVGGAAAAANQVTLPDNSAYRFDGKIVARSSSGNVATWDVKGLVKRGSGAGSVALVGTPTVTQVFADAGATSWAVSIGVNTTIGCLTVTVTGAASTTIRWNAAIDTTEVSFA